MAIEEQPAESTEPAPGPKRSYAGDRALRELDALTDALTRNKAILDRIIDKAAHIRQARVAGARYRDIVAQEERPLLVEMLTDNQHRLTEAGGRWRRAEAQALRAEGASVEEIANLFGVSRQRAAVLLKPSPR